MSGVQSASGIPSTPHPKVRALYGYEYISSDGRVIKMTEGEEFFLLKKANEDWWQVKRPTESKPIYVPATYVEEKPIEQSPVLKTFGKIASFNGAGSGLRNGSTDQPTSPKSKIVATISLPLNPYEGFRGSVLMQDDSEYAEITFKEEEETTHLSTGSSQSPSPLPNSPLALTARSSSPVYTNLEELKLVQGTDFPPTPTGEPIVTSEDSWETHLDESSNRFFYRNLLSGEMSWKPPRRARPPTPPPDYSPSQSSLAAAPQAILPPGWQEEMDAKGEISFTHLASPDKWKRLMDENGKVYFYTSKGDSVWELPKLESPPPTEEPRAGTLPRASHASERSLHSSTLPRGTGTSSSSSFSSSSAAMTQDVKPALSSFGMATLPRASAGSSDRQFGTGAGGSSSGSGSSGIGSTTSALAATSLVATLRPGGPDKPQLVLTEQGTVTAVNWRVRQGGLDRAIQAKSVFIPDEPKITPHKRTLSDHDLSDKAAPATVNPLSPPLDKAGMLNKTKIMEAGKKLRKNWAPSWVVLSGSSLVFHKEPKAQTAASWKTGSAQSKPEGSVELRGAHVEWARDKSSKKNVFQIQTGTGHHEFLLQSDNDTIINEWFQAIRSVIQKLSSEPGNRDEVFLSVVKFGGNFDEVDGSGGEEESSESPLREKSKDSKRPWVGKPAVVESTDKKKAKRKLMKFFPKRPPIQSLRDKGLIKEQVFGCPLAMLCERENTTVPKFVQLSIETVDKRGLCIDGIYRVSGNLATIQKLRFLVDHEEKVSLDESHWEDIHVITGALKMFFRELPEPLFPFNQFDPFISAIKLQDSREKLTKIKEQVQKLPKPNKDTMRALFEHLKKVIACGDANRMTTQSVAIVFGPTLLRPENESSSMAFHLVYQNQIVEFILSEFTTVFGV
uniref:Rho GTPase-activating protein 12-like isoform X2 n=1 Tax=Petromyzon marinus TaxID=7757 RepID=A0AAJ7SMY2_PETMA|nr:rho GTPase-activating protein 12-like isoform X2 [Petromyzon marinus]